MKIHQGLCTVTNLQQFKNVIFSSKYLYYFIQLAITIKQLHIFRFDKKVIRINKYRS